MARTDRRGRKGERERQLGDPRRICMWIRCSCDTVLLHTVGYAAAARLSLAELNERLQVRGRAHLYDLVYNDDALSDEHEVHRGLYFGRHQQRIDFGPLIKPQYSLPAGKRGGIADPSGLHSSSSCRPHAWDNFPLVYWRCLSHFGLEAQRKPHPIFGK